MKKYSCLKVCMLRNALILSFAVGVSIMSCITHATGLPTDGLQAHFRADHKESLTATSVFPKQGDFISAWTNEASVAQSVSLYAAKDELRPTYQRAAFLRADGTTRPALRFGNVSGSTYTLLDSTADTTFDIGTASTWFLVMKSRDSLKNKNKGVFGFANDPRFGTFFPSEDTLRLFNNYSSSTEGNVNIEEGAQILVDSRSNGTRLTKGVNGINSGASQQATTRSVAAKFHMGRFSNFDNARYSAEFDCAELAIYNRALNDAETCIVRNALAARWGLAIENSIWKGSTLGFCDDLAGIGASTATGTDHIPGVVETSSLSGGLAVSVSAGSLSGMDGYLLVAHNGEASALVSIDKTARLARTWRVESTFLSVPSVTFAFDLGTLGFISDSFSGRLFRRTATDTAYVDTGLTGILSDGVLSFTFDVGADIAGEYAFVVDNATIRPCAGASRALQGWFRADTGVTVANGVVTRWRNLGLAEDRDLTEVTGTPTLSTTAFPRSSGMSESSVNFNGISILSTASAVDWGISRNCTWFAVFKSASSSPKNVGIFGNSDTSTRFGSFFNGSGGLRAYGYANSNYLDQYCEATSDGFSASSAIVEEFVHTGANFELCLNGAHKDGKTTKSTVPDGNASVFMIGQMVSMANKFNGDIAEVRIYNNRLTDTERNIVANHLAARYGVTLGGRSLYSGASDGCALDVVGVGCGVSNSSIGDDKVIYTAGSMFESEDSAGLTMTVETLSAGDYVLAGHGEKLNKWIKADLGVRRMKRAWHITKTNAASLDLKLVFTFGKAGIEPLEDKVRPQYKLFRSVDGGSTWASVDVPLTRNGHELICILPANTFVEGQYTVGADVIAQGFAIVIK